MSTQGFRRDQGGATSIEYGVIAAAVALAALTLVWTAGGAIQARFAAIAEAVGIKRQADTAGAAVVRSGRGRD